MSTFDFSPMLRYSVGFDRMQRQIATASARTEATYPPYNIETNDKDAYRVQLQLQASIKTTWILRSKMTN